MTLIRPLNSLECPLEGTHLIEASAGTGKTYTITSLFLRLLLEKRLEVGRILVVTYTEAATEELKERIRTRIREALSIFSGESGEDAYLNGLLEKYGDTPLKRALLTNALRDFDSAAIFTIHGFCFRMLRDHAFESGALFDARMVADGAPFRQEVAEDFWRNHVYGASAMLVRYLMARTSVADWRELLDKAAAQPDLKVIPTPEAADSRNAEKAFLDAFHEARTLWREHREEVASLMTASEALNRNKYRPTSVSKWLRAMNDYLEDDTPGPVLFDGFMKFTPQVLAASVKKGRTPPAHLFFETCGRLQDACETLQAIFDQTLIRFKVTLVEAGRRALGRKNADANRQTFDDLLLRMRSALQDPRRGDALAWRIRERFKAALIDEFQDTDPVQYAIFERLFRHGDHTLFLIGDPKQAIYGFRGADIFTYMLAARRSPSRFTLDTNYRSSPNLVRAINAVFFASGETSAPFLFDDIPFFPVHSAREKTGHRIIAIDGRPAPALILWWHDGDAETGKPLNKGTARDRIVQAVTSEIARLVRLGRTGRCTLAGKPLAPGDIAVLVRRNSEAESVQQALTRLGIPSVRHGTGDIYDSEEALDIQQVLAAAADPRNERLIRTALVSDIFGVTAPELARLIRNESEWEARLAAFESYHQIWRRAGFMRMFKSLIAAEGVLPRLMGMDRGERRVTNLLHLTELLHQAETERGGIPADLVQWLSDQRHSEQRTEEHPLRLESDADAVKLVTIHKSKGLEYPVVFCPFTWDGVGNSRRQDDILFHDAENDHRRVLDLGSSDAETHRRLAMKETMAENLRLLYVALTRAKIRCYWPVGRIKDAETSAPLYLLAGGDASTGADDILDRIQSRIQGMGDAAFRKYLDALVERSKGDISVRELPETDDAPFDSPPETEAAALAVRTFSGRIRDDFRMTSFSALTAGSETETRGGMSAVSSMATPEAGPDDRDIFSFPRGAVPGTCLHTILENVDLADFDPDHAAMTVTPILRNHGIDPQWTPTVCRMLRTLARTPLDPGQSGPVLSRVSKGDRITEMNFCFPLNPISPESLSRVFREHAVSSDLANLPERIGRLEFSPVRGYLRGFIDLVFRHDGRFYIIDWKSNHLGETPADYERPAMAAAMAASHYVLQYHLYVLALHEYLKGRMPGYDYEACFGGVFYVFLRGIGEGDRGIFRDRPSQGCIRGLSQLMIPKTCCNY